MYLDYISVQINASEKSMLQDKMGTCVKRMKITDDCLADAMLCGKFLN